MIKKNRFFSFELLLAVLLIVAFFLPWLDMWGIKVSGWDIPELQKKMTKVTNFFKFFSKKDWVYSTHVVYLIPVLSSLVILFWLFLRVRFARILLMITGIFSAIVTVNLFYKLPKAGTGVYLLAATTIVIIIYSIIIFRRKKKVEEILPEELDVIEEEIDILNGSNS